MISGLVLKYLNGECFVIRRGYESLPAQLKLVLSDSAVSDDLMLAYFAGASIGRALMDGTFKGSQNSYGLSVGGYFVRSFNDTVYVNGFASLGQSNHKLEIADDTLDLNSSYNTRTATLGGTVTGVMPQAGYEIWSELGFTYAKTKVGTMDFTGTAYGLTADNLSLDGGSVEMGNSQVGLSSEAKQSHLCHR